MTRTVSKKTKFKVQDLTRCFFLLFVGVVLLHLLLPTTQYAKAETRTFFVDPQGKDTNNGLLPERAWRSLARVSREHLKPGDTVLLRSGNVWHEPLIITSSGLPGRPIRFARYGEGSPPRIECTRDLTIDLSKTAAFLEGIKLTPG